VPIVPDAAGSHLAAAFALVRDAGLRPVLIGLPTTKSTGNTGYVVAAQEPAAGLPVEPGTRVALAATTRLLSFGGPIDGRALAAPGSPVPDLIGVDVEKAMARATDEGFIAVVFQPELGVEQLSVCRQEPAPGDPVEPFREVALWLDEPPAAGAHRRSDV
jgi:beta-lactam-binding protein with PASTA domain